MARYVISKDAIGIVRALCFVLTALLASTGTASRAAEGNTGISGSTLESALDASPELEAAVIPACTTIVPAGLVAGETWTAAGSPYCVTGDIQVTLLTLQPGTTVLVDGDYQIEVLSTITAIGTSSSPILFSARTPGSCWKGLFFQNTLGGSQFRHCIFESADSSAVTLNVVQATTFEDCEFRGNHSATSGGAVNANGVTGDLIFRNCSFFGNVADAGDGGSVNAVGVTGSVILQSCRFSGNSASYSGGAVHVQVPPAGPVTITDCIFEHNVANPNLVIGNYMGGALWLSGGTANVSRTRFVGNQANALCSSVFGCGVQASGGGIYVDASGTLSIVNAEFLQNNTYAYNGGQCFFGGTSYSLGAGLYVASGNVALEEVMMSCNVTTASPCGEYHAGAGFYLENGTVSVVNSTIARNSDTTGISQGGGSVNISSSIIFFNNANGTQIAGTPTVTYSDVQNGFTGLGNISANPVFGGTGCDLGDLVPVLGSPCVNAGNPDAAGNDTCFPPSLGTTRNDMGITGGPAACNWYPSETSSLVFPSRDVLSWKRSFMDTKYSIYRGLIGSPFAYSHACLGTSLMTSTYTDPSIPGTDQGYFYLVSQTNRNGEGSLGVRESRVTVCGNTSTMTQAQRPNLSPCP